MTICNSETLTQQICFNNSISSLLVSWSSKLNLLLWFIFLFCQFLTIEYNSMAKVLWWSQPCKPVHPKGNQQWIFIGRTDAEVLILWPPDAKSWFIGKDSDAGKDWGQEEKGATEDNMMDGITDTMDLSFSKLREIVKDRAAWCAAVHGVSGSGTWLSDQTPRRQLILKQTDKTFYFYFYCMNSSLSKPHELFDVALSIKQ